APSIPQPLPNSQTIAPASLAAVLQNMANVPQAMMGHGMLLQAQSPQMPNMLPPARDLVQQRMDRTPRPGQQTTPEPPKKQDAVARQGEAAQEEKPPPPEEDSEPIRCHFHRKPQLNCKICRRVYYSAVDPNSQKKDDRKGSEKKPEDETPGARMRGAEAFEITNKQTYNFNSMLRDQILKNTYFKTLVKIDTFEGIMDEMYQYVETAETYGGGSTTVPSSLFCCLYRLFTIGLSYDELNLLCESKDWPYIRCCGFLYIRFGCAPEKLWDFLGEYCVDDQEFEPSKSTPGFVVTIGEYVESLLLDERYYYSTLPRIPMGVMKKIEQKVAPLGQYRKRAAQNKAILHFFREPGTPVEACRDNGTWVSGQTLSVIESVPSRITIRVRAADGREEVYPLGRVILREDPKKLAERARSRSRSPKRDPAGPRSHSPDLTRNRGQSIEEMLEELRAKQRERAVCSTGKDYHRKPIGFMSGLAMKRDVGQASTRLREEETYAPRQVEHRKQIADESILSRPETERDREQQLLKQQLFEKYGNINPRTTAKEQQQPADMDIEDASVLRLG
ncbi:SRL1, partial [Symbiodinium pilosum]